MVAGRRPTCTTCRLRLFQGRPAAGRGGLLRRRCARCRLQGGRIHLNGRPDLPAHGPRPGLLAGRAVRRAVGRGAAGGRGLGQAPGLQRGAQAPEGGGPPLALLVRPPGPARLGGDAQRARLVGRGRGAAPRGVGAGRRPGRQPPLRRRLGAGQREHGLPRPGGPPPRAVRFPGARRRRHAAPRPPPAGDRQRRLGAHRRHGRGRHPRLRPRGRAVRARLGGLPPPGDAGSTTACCAPGTAGTKGAPGTGPGTATRCSSTAGPTADSPWWSASGAASSSTGGPIRPRRRWRRCSPSAAGWRPTGPPSSPATRRWSPRSTPSPTSPATAGRS